MLNTQANFFDWMVTSSNSTRARGSALLLKYHELIRINQLSISYVTIVILILFTVQVDLISETYCFQNENNSLPSKRVFFELL